MCRILSSLFLVKNMAMAASVEMFCGMKCRLLSSLMLIVLVANVHDGCLSKHWQFKLFLQEYKSDDHILLEISSSCIFRRHFPIVILTPEKNKPVNQSNQQPTPQIVQSYCWALDMAMYEFDNIIL